MCFSCDKISIVKQNVNMYTNKFVLLSHDLWMMTFDMFYN